MSISVVRLKPLFYVHIHDSNANITTLLSGPATYTLPPHQNLVTQEPQPFVVVPPEHYAVIENPVLRDSESGSLVLDRHGGTKNALGDKEIRQAQLPFPLYPGEKLAANRKLVVLSHHQAIVLHCTRTFTDDRGGEEGAKVTRAAGDEFMLRGPRTYIPKVEEDIVEKREAIIIKQNEALTLRAKTKFLDSTGVERHAGEEYLYEKPGSYILSIDEVLLGVAQCVILTNKKAIHVEVVNGFKDNRKWANGVMRKAGQVYLLTNKETAEFTPRPSERIVQEVQLVAVTHRQFAVILDPVENGIQQLGRRKVVTNRSFFLQPGESLEGDGVRPTYVLGVDEAILLSALEEFSEGDKSHGAGELWLLEGPVEYVPHAHVKVMSDNRGQEVRRRLVLPEGEGVYVRNTLSGEIRAVTGCTYMLAANEELWEKDVPRDVETLLTRQGNSHSSYMDQVGGAVSRDRTKVVKYMIPHNAVTQVYDYKKRTQRTIFGPEAVLLGPDEQFTLLSLSGSAWDPSQPNKCFPKETGRIKALYMFLGPSALSDVLNVETSDHARLSLQLSYDWYFDVAQGNKSHADEAFRVPDFVGDACSCIASRIRASIAAVPFKKFHRHSSSMLTAAVFGIDGATQQPKKELRFPSNRLVVTSVDIQEITIIDEKTREALHQSVKMAIEITTKAAEASARQEASVREQQARGRLERQRIDSDSQCEGDRKALLTAETRSSTIEHSGQAKAIAKAKAEAANIEGDSHVEAARIRAKTLGVEDQVRLALQQRKDIQELDHRSHLDTLEVEHTKSMTNIESQKFQQTMDAIGPDTVTALARAGPELQAKLLKSMGLEGFLVTDGSNPINLFNTARGMTAPPSSN